MPWIFVPGGLWLIYICVTGLLKRRRGLAQVRASGNWPAVQGTVLSVNVIHGTNYNSETRQEYHTYRPEITYRYPAKGTEHTGTRLAFGNILYYQSAEAEIFKAAYPVGGPVTVYHDPANPSEAVIDRDPKHATNLIGGDIVFLLFGLGLVAMGIFGFISQGGR